MTSGRFRRWGEFLQNGVLMENGNMGFRERIARAVAARSVPVCFRLAGLSLPSFCCRRFKCPFEVSQVCVLMCALRSPRVKSAGLVNVLHLKNREISHSCTFPILVTRCLTVSARWSALEILEHMVFSLARPSAIRVDRLQLLAVTALVFQGEGSGVFTYVFGIIAEQRQS